MRVIFDLILAIVFWSIIVFLLKKYKISFRLVVRIAHTQKQTKFAQEMEKLTDGLLKTNVINSGKDVKGKDLPNIVKFIYNRKKGTIKFIKFKRKIKKRQSLRKVFKE